MKKTLWLIIYLILIVFMVISILFSVLYKKENKIIEIGNDVEYSNTDNVIYSFSELKYRDLAQITNIKGRVIYKDIATLNVSTASEIFVEFGDILNAGDAIANIQSTSITSDSKIKIIDIKYEIDDVTIKYVKLEDIIITCELPMKDNIYLSSNENISIYMGKAGNQISYNIFEYDFNKELYCYDVFFGELTNFYIQNEEIDIQFIHTEKKDLLLINKNCVYKDENNNYFARSISINENGNVVINKEQLTVINEYELYYEVVDTDKIGEFFLYY